MIDLNQVLFAGITLETVDCLIIDALEGGSKYWYLLGDPPKMPENAERNPDVHYTFLDAIYNGAEIAVFDCENETDKLGTITMQGIKDALPSMAEQYPQHFGAIMTEDYDAETADVFLQVVVMGEIVYG